MSKKALLIGINYTGSNCQLNGCVNDVLGMSEILQGKGYNVKIFTDNTKEKPTRHVILRELLELILSGSEKLYFHYSGHGSYQDDVKGGDEIDGRDECLVPIDYETNGMIVDDEIRGILNCLLPSQRLFCVIDACHSGTSCDLKYNYDMEGKPMKDDKNYIPTRGECIMLSGCRDDQTSADAWEQKKYQGALTFSFVTALRENVKDYESLVKSVRNTLKTHNYEQIACLSSGKMLNLKSTFTL